MLLGHGEEGSFSTVLAATRGLRSPHKQLSKPNSGFVSDGADGSERQSVGGGSRNRSSRCLRQAGGLLAARSRPTARTPGQYKDDLFQKRL